MAEYISREAFSAEMKKRQDAAKEWLIEATGTDDADGKVRAETILSFLCEVKLTLESIPAADVREVRWIPVTERLPEKNGYYLTYVKSALYFDSYYQNLLRFIDGDFIEDHVVIHRVTHWMPLPAPPKEETE